MDHDALFKEVLRTFFAEFMQLFFPEVSAQLDLSQVTFLDKELFSDLMDGIQREPDLIAQIRTKDGEPETVLVHTEVEGRRHSVIRSRMFEYYALLRWRFKLPVFPIVLYLSPGAGGLVTEQYVESLFGRDVTVFTYSAVGLPDLQSDDYQTEQNVLAPALSALMRRQAASVEWRKSTSACSLWREVGWTLPAWRC
jgi:hypothetical protein